MAGLTIETHRCPVCDFQSTASDFINPPVTFQCSRCGEFRIDVDAYTELKSARLAPRKTANLSGYLRENQGMLLTIETLQRLSELRTPTVDFKAGKLLLQIAREWPRPGEIIELSTYAPGPAKILGKFADSARFVGVAWAEGHAELAYLLDEFLGESGFVRKEGENYLVTPAGWRRVAELQSSGPKSDQGFVAMKFGTEFHPLFDNGLARGIFNAGYVPVRIDRTEHNNRIDDEIVAKIQQSRFLVADFTVDRGGIYFEAGYAMGLGRPVIWTVCECALDAVHFDNRQYNFIVWNEGQWDDLAIRLKNRIEATIGKGPNATA